MINAVVLYKQLANVDGICCIRFKFIGDIIKIITYYNKLYPAHLLYDNKKNDIKI